MDITLNVLRCPDAAVPESRRSSGGDLAIGRGHESDWQLQDPERVLSKRHCLLEFRSGGWQLRDLSTNGTFLNHAQEPVGRDLVAPLKDGDRLRLGSYEIEVRIAAATTSPGWGAPLVADPSGTGRHVPDPFADPFAPVPAGLPSPGFGDTAALPDDFDPFGDEPPMPDHQPAASDAFVPPRAGPVAALPDDWGLDFDIAAPAQPAMPAPPAAPPAMASPAAPAAAAPAEPLPFPPAQPRAAEPAPLSMPASVAAAAPSPMTDPFAEEGVQSFAVPGINAPPSLAIAPPVVAQPPPTAPAMAAPEAADAVAILLRAAGLSPTALPGADPAAVLEAAGASLRAAIAGIRALLIARADVKREFRIEQTMLRAAGNNPLKFAATDEAALTALLGTRGGARAVEATVGDLTAHEVATLAATQAAARALLDRLAPAGLEAADKGGGFLGGRERRLWDAYKALHTQVAEQFEDDFDSAFGRAFARAYEEASRKDAGP